MSAFKKLKLSEISLSVYNAQKNWTYSYPSASSTITEINTLNNSGSLFLDDEYFDDKKYFRSINQLYFSNFRAGSFQSGSFDNYLQSSFFSGSREIGNTVKIFSLSRDVIGTHIVPRSITFDFLPVEFYIVNESNYVDETLPSGRYILEEV